MTRPQTLPLFLLVTFLCSAFSPSPVFSADPEPDDYKVLKEIIVLEFSNEAPHEWGPSVAGVRTHLKTPEKVVAVTIDAAGKGVNSDLLAALVKERIPVTLFVSGEWLDTNRDIVKKLAANPLFEIANLGLESKSFSVAGKAPAGVPSTKNAEEVFTEIEKNARRIETLTGILPRFFRAGPGYYDDVAVRIAKALGYEVVAANSLKGKNAGSKEGFADVLLKASAGSIAAVSMDASAPDAVDDLKQAVSKLRTKGFQFVKLSDYPLE